MEKKLKGCLESGGSCKVKIKFKYFKALVKFGHVGNKKYIERQISTAARSKKEAIELMRNMPRCKTHLDEAVTNIQETSKKEYNDIQREYHKDPYFKCKTEQDIKINCPDIDKEIKTLKSKGRKKHKHSRNELRGFHAKFDKLLIDQADRMIRNYLLEEY